jgi:hypothetical protein
MNNGFMRALPSTSTSTQRSFARDWHGRKHRRRAAA